MTEVPFQGTSSLAIDPELVHADSEGDEGSEVPQLSRSRETKGPAVVMTGASLGEVSERRTTGGDPCEPQCLLKLFRQAPFSVK